MNKSNKELIQLMQELGLSREEVAKLLNTPLTTVYQWTRKTGSKKQEAMPESELKLLKYSLMSENKYTTLF